MPTPRPKGTFNGGPLLPRWLRAIFAWRTVRKAGVYAYQENSVTGARRAVRVYAGGHCPVDTYWINADGWPRPDAPPIAPRGGPAERRQSVREAFHVASEQTGAFKRSGLTEAMLSAGLDIRSADARALYRTLRSSAPNGPRLVAKPRYRVAALSRPHQAA